MLCLCLLLSGCGKRAPKSPEFYEIGENSVISLDQFMGEAEGTLVELEKPTEETPDQYTYYYDEMLDPPGKAKIYYNHLILPEQGFTLTDETYLPTEERKARIDFAENGYLPLGEEYDGVSVTELNNGLGVSPAQVQAMKCGSMIRARRYPSCSSN